MSECPANSYESATSKHRHQGASYTEFDTDGIVTATVTAPLPNVSLRLVHRFGDKWYLGGTLGYFDITVDEIKGELVTARGGLEWRAFKNFGFGVGYQYVTIDVKEDESDRQNRIDADFYGPVLFVSAAF